MRSNREIYNLFEEIGDCISSTVDENGMPASSRVMRMASICAR